MRLPKFFRSSKKVPLEIEQKSSSEATELDAKAFFSGLIDTYIDNFRVDTPEQALNAFRTIPQLNTVISTSAKAFTRANKNLYDVDKKGAKTLNESGDLYDVLRRPHLLQSENEYWNTAYINWAIFGIKYTRKEESIGVKLKSLLCLPTVDVIAFIKENANYLTPKSMKDIIDFYELDTGNGTVTKIKDVNSIWTLGNSSLSIKNDGYLIPENPLKPLEKTLGTLYIINNIKNELLGNHGAVGIINPDSSDVDGDAVALEQDDKDDLQKAYNEYGLTRGKNKLIITNVSLKFTSISLKMAELLLNEYEAAATRTLANNMNFPPPLLTGEIKYENKDAANKELYENKIIPESSIFESSFNAEFNLRENNQVLEFDYSHISYLQKDLKAEAQRHKIESDTFINYNTAVADRKTDRETAINTLVFQGLSQEQAESLIHQPIVITTEPEIEILEE